MECFSKLLTTLLFNRLDFALVRKEICQILFCRKCYLFNKLAYLLFCWRLWLTNDLTIGAGLLMVSRIYQAGLAHPCQGNFDVHASVPVISTVDQSSNPLRLPKPSRVISRSYPDN